MSQLPPGIPDSVCVERNVSNSRGLGGEPGPLICRLGGLGCRHGAWSESEFR